MRITEIIEIPGSTDLVTFTGPAGQAWGRWCGAFPISSPCCVEVDLPEPVTAWEHARTQDVLAGNPGKELTVCAVVDSVDADGVVSLRLASDIILVEWEAIARAAVGERIRFYAPAAAIYPYAL